MPIILPLKIEPLMISSGPKKKVIYPQVIDFENLKLERFINRIIVEQTQELINLQVGNMPSTVEEMLGEFEIKNNQRQVLSLTLSNYTYHDRAAHGMTYIKSLTFDLKEEKRCELKDLFKPGSDYVNRLSGIIQNQIIERKIEPLEKFTAINPNQDFYIADKSLVIYYQLYELTYYAYGFPMFPISVYEIQDIIDENGVLGRMAEHN